MNAFTDQGLSACSVSLLPGRSVEFHAQKNETSFHENKNNGHSEKAVTFKQKEIALSRHLNNLASYICQIIWQFVFNIGCMVGFWIQINYAIIAPCVTKF